MGRVEYRGQFMWSCSKAHFSNLCIAYRSSPFQTHKAVEKLPFGCGVAFEFLCKPLHLYGPVLGKFNSVEKLWLAQFPGWKLLPGVPICTYIFIPTFCWFYFLVSISGGLLLRINVL